MKYALVFPVIAKAFIVEIDHGSAMESVIRTLESLLIVEVDGVVSIKTPAYLVPTGFGCAFFGEEIKPAAFAKQIVLGDDWAKKVKATIVAWPAGERAAAKVALHCVDADGDKWRLWVQCAIQAEKEA